MDDPTDKSLGDAATYAGAKARPARDEVSLGDERTLGGGEAVGLDTLIDEIEVVDLESRYKVEGTLGQGGMGAVLLATDTRLGRKVAIKRILGEAARSKTAIMRFLTEAKAIAALNHPNIVQIYDYGRAEDGPFLIMEYVDGGSLADRCKQGAIPLEEAVELACQICDGLAKAHDAGIVHRDIKPANVLLNRDNLPKLTDFGLAKAEAADHGMTMTGAVMGTPDFMPPEQRRDAALVDHRSDLWSLAASVYQMVTGRSPKIIRFNDVPVVLQDVLARALEEEKDARYQSARELRDALKTSVRAASAAVEELVQGQCPACGVKNDASRRFCRGCGESLEAPCLACTRPMPMWEEICGSCGAKQTPLLDERRQAMAARQAEAEGLLGEFAFDRATEVATQLRDTSHPKLRHLAGWTTTFFERVETSRAEQMRHAAEVLAEARKHEAAHDYLSAAFALETIPEVMRSSLIPGTREPAGRMLERVRKTQADVRRLESLVKERLAARQFDDLLPDVDKLLALRPDRADIIKVRTQLVERQQKQAGHRDKAIETARASLAEHDYEAALAGLSSVAAAAVTPEVVKLREQAEELVRKVRSLAKKIKDKVAAKDLDGLIGTVEQYLALKPADGEHVALRQSLAAREEKIAGEITARCEQAAALEKACRFDDAIKLLGAIPESRRSEAVLELLDRASQRATWRRSAMTALGAATPQTFEAAIAIGRDYAAAIDSGNLSDTDFTALLQKVEAARDRAVQSRRLKLVTGAAAAGIAAVVAIVVAGMWIRSAVKTASLARAIARHPGEVSAVPTKALRELPAAAFASPALRNSIGVELKLLPAGTFTMGQAGGGSDETPHKVTLTQPFFIGVHEVTNAQWKAVMGSVPSMWKEDYHPVEQISWEDAVEFCRRLSALPEERNAGRVYRLPTEAEWEYACRAGTKTQYSFGDDASRLGEYAWYDGNAGNQTHSVGTKKPNAWGIYDMHGNVDEWCHDSYSREYQKGARTDPQGSLTPRKRITPWSFLDTPPVVSIATLVAMSSYVGTGAVSGLPFGQISLTELQATQQARQQMEANAAGAAANARPQMHPDNAGPAASQSARVIRGGGWRFTARYCWSANRRRDNPSARFNYLGFRLAMTPSGVGHHDAAPPGGQTRASDSTVAIPAAPAAHVPPRARAGYVPPP